MSNNQTEIFLPVEKLGSGAFAEVFLATLDGKSVCAKKVKEKKHENTLKQEYVLLKMLRGDTRTKPPRGIIRPFGYILYNGSYYIAMEMANGSLKDLEENPQFAHGLSSDIIYKLVSDMGAGLSALLRYGVVHLDIKQANIVYFAFNQGIRNVYIFKYCDFGVSQCVNLSESRAFFDGSEAFMAPSTLANHKYHQSLKAEGIMLTPEHWQYLQFITASRADLWSIAMVFATLLAGKNPIQVSAFGMQEKSVVLNNRALQKARSSCVVNPILTKGQTDFTYQATAAVTHKLLRQEEAQEIAQLMERFEGMEQIQLFNVSTGHIVQSFPSREAMEDPLLQLRTSSIGIVPGNQYVAMSSSGIRFITMPDDANEAASSDSEPEQRPSDYIILNARSTFQDPFNIICLRRSEIERGTEEEENCLTRYQNLFEAEFNKLEAFFASISQDSEIESHAFPSVLTDSISKLLKRQDDDLLRFPHDCRYDLQVIRLLQRTVRSLPESIEEQIAEFRSIVDHLYKSNKSHLEFAEVAMSSAENIRNYLANMKSTNFNHGILCSNYNFVLSVFTKSLKDICAAFTSVDYITECESNLSKILSAYKRSGTLELVKLCNDACASMAMNQLNEKKRFKNSINELCGCIVQVMDYIVKSSVPEDEALSYFPDIQLITCPVPEEKTIEVITSKMEDVKVDLDEDCF